jgi:hypothetical protein
MTPLALMACAVLESPPSGGDGSLGFPHPADYDLGPAHGAEAARSQAACLDCHAVPGSSAPSCASCHEAYPHLEGWIREHGASELACEGCHAVEGLQATDRWGCDSCHAAFPHGASWERPEQHGAWFTARGAEEALCSGCHEDMADCSDCHEAYPHASGWSLPERHGAQALLDTEVCASCHGADFSGGTTKVACSTCHASYPHPADQLRAHLPASRVGEAVCLRCHEPGDGPATVQASCSASCHGEAE